MFSVIYTRINGWVDYGEAGDLRRHGTHYDVNVMHCRGLCTISKDRASKYMIWANDIRRDLRWILEECSLFEQLQVNKVGVFKYPSEFRMVFNANNVVVMWLSLTGTECCEIGQTRSQTCHQIMSLGTYHVSDLHQACHNHLSPCTNNIEKVSCETYATDLAHCGLVTPCNDICLAQDWLI